MITISQDIIESLEYLNSEDRGKAYMAIFDYIYYGKLPDDSLDGAARMAFELARRKEFDPKMRRNAKARERRKAIKEAKAKQHASTNSPQAASEQKTAPYNLLPRQVSKRPNHSHENRRRNGTSANYCTEIVKNSYGGA